MVDTTYYQRSFMLLILLLGSALLTGCADGKSTIRVGRTISVSFQITSGIPPPTWTLTRAEADTLQAKLDALPSTTGTLQVQSFDPILLSLQYDPDATFYWVAEGQVGQYLSIPGSGPGLTGVLKSDPKYTIPNYILATYKARIGIDPTANQSTYDYVRSKVPQP